MSSVKQEFGCGLRLFVDVVRIVACGRGPLVAGVGIRSGVLGPEVAYCSVRPRPPTSIAKYSPASDLLSEVVMPIETLEQELKNPRLQAALASAWWSEEEAELILSVLERSGLTVREFAKRTQVGAARCLLYTSRCV